MKFYTFIFLFCLLACKQFIPEKELTFNKIEIKKNSSLIEPDSSIKFNLNISYLKPITGPQFLIDSINLATKQLFSAWFTLDNTDDFGLEQASQKKIEQFINKVKQSPNVNCLSCRVNELNVDIENEFHNAKILNLVYKLYVYNGGAHPIYARKSIVINKKTGSIISYNDLFTDISKVEIIAQNILKQDLGIKENDNLNEVYQFSNNKFHLGKQFMVTNKGVTIIYNPYEIAPYSVGIISIDLPYSSIKDFLKFDLP